MTLARSHCRILVLTCVSRLIRGGDCHGAFLPHRECVCYDRCPRCSVEFELEVDFDHVNPTRPEDEIMAPLTVTSRDLVSFRDSEIIVLAKIYSDVCDPLEIKQ